MKLFKISGYSIFVTTLLLVMSFFRIDVAAQDNYLTAREAPKVLNGTKVLNLEPSSLTGYCSSSGGSTKFESIQAVDVSPNPDGSTLTITVSVYIANPNGCESGKSCSSYDANPESVNVWIDWNGNGTFDSSEQVINVNATGYLNINYSGTMTVLQQFTIPSSYADKFYFRANLGWGSDPGPCDPGWSWGKVVDKKITLPALQVPKVTDLKLLLEQSDRFGWPPRFQGCISAGEIERGDFAALVEVNGGCVVAGEFLAPELSRALVQGEAGKAQAIAAHANERGRPVGKRIASEQCHHRLVARQ